MDDRTAFHAAIFAAPDDDLPKLVYADWLDEHAEHDRAAFLRLLCAAHTCPPVLDKLRPLVAELRRAMVKVGAAWVEEVCPVPPAVVVGAWVDADHEANREPLDWVRKQKRGREEEPERMTTYRRLVRGVQSIFNRAPTPPPPTIPPAPVRPTLTVPLPDEYVELVWEAMLPALTPAAACVVEGLPALVDVWSGVVMAVAINDGYCRIRKPPEKWDDAALHFRHRQPHHERWSELVDALGPEGDLDYYFQTLGIWEHERKLLEQAVAEFDPANG